MADTIRSQDYFLNASTGALKDNTSGAITAQMARDVVLSSYRPQSSCDGRLTLESGVPVSTTDQTAKTSVYFTPINGNLLGLYDGTSWKLYTFTELTLALGTLTSGKNYDIFVYDNSGTLTLELSAAWTNDTTRADALTTQDGIYVKNGATTRRYVGTIRTTATTTTEDSLAKRFCWNLYNQQNRALEVFDSAASWTLATGTFRNANNSATNRVQVVTGLAGPNLLDLRLLATIESNASGTCLTGIAEDGTAPHASCFGRYGMASGTLVVDATFPSVLRISPTAGFHYYQWVEANQGGTTTIYGLSAASPPSYKSGLTGTIQA